jgi:hypothetical protein
MRASTFQRHQNGQNLCLRIRRLARLYRVDLLGGRDSFERLSISASDCHLSRKMLDSFTNCAPIDADLPIIVSARHTSIAETR